VVVLARPRCRPSPAFRKLGVSRAGFLGLLDVTDASSPIEVLDYMQTFAVLRNPDSAATTLVY
jgi:hypothetical protein